jgi:CRP-like cAMP-binding protein
MMNVKLELLTNNTVFSPMIGGQPGYVIGEHIGAPESFHETFGKIKSVKVDAGNEIVRHRDKGDRYYIIKEGRAEVWKPDLEADKWSCVALLGPGDAFGEEAILVGGYRNATVRMITPGILLVLEEDVFNAALRSRLVEEVTPGQAKVMARCDDTKWLDCRYDIEYSEVRIPGAQLMPLHTLRQSTHELDQGKRYLVYCRRGQRSVCATYLLRERGFNAFSLKGGIRDWPYALESGT